MKNTTLIYLERNGKYLMLNRNRKENDENLGKWIGVGGKFEDGESPEECAVRETFEETGLRVNSLEYRGIVTFVSNEFPCEYMHLFTSKDFSGEQITCNEGDLAWIDKNDVFSLPLWEGDKVFLDYLLKDKPFFSLKLVYEGENLIKSTCNFYKNA